MGKTRTLRSRDKMPPDTDVQYHVLPAPSPHHRTGPFVQAAKHVQGPIIVGSAGTGSGTGVRTLGSLGSLAGTLAICLVSRVPTWYEYWAGRPFPVSSFPGTGDSIFILRPAPNSGSEYRLYYASCRVRKYIFLCFRTVRRSCTLPHRLALGTSAQVLPETKGMDGQQQQIARPEVGLDARARVVAIQTMPHCVCRTPQESTIGRGRKYSTYCK